MWDYASPRNGFSFLWWAWLPVFSIVCWLLHFFWESASSHHVFEWSDHCFCYWTVGAPNRFISHTVDILLGGLFVFLASLACLSVLFIAFLFFVFHHLLLVNSQIKVSNSRFNEAIHTLVVSSAVRMAVWHYLVLPEPETETRSPFLYSNKEKEN